VYPKDTVMSSRLADDNVITGAIVCTERARRVPGDGEWMFRTVVALSGGGLAALSTALHQHIDVGTVRECAGVGWDTPPWAVTLADGRHLQPEMPSDGCGPPRATLDALGAALARPDAVVTRVRQTQPETQVVSGCYDGTKFIVPGDRMTAATQTVAPPRRGRATVCRYDMTDGSGVETAGGVRMPVLAGTGTSAAVDAAVDAVYATLRPGKPASCTTDRPTAVLSVQPALGPKDGPTGPQTYIEVGGCNLILSPDSAVIGSVDRLQVAALSALASERVMAPVEY
jgi:hypothetical protein